MTSIFSLFNAQHPNCDQVFGLSETKLGGEEKGGNLGANQNVKSSRPLPNGFRSAVCGKLWKF